MGMSSGPKKAQIAVEVEDQWYVELRIENPPTNNDGNEVKLETRWAANSFLRDRP